MRRLLAYAAGLGLPLVLFLAPLHAVGAAHAELRIDKVPQAPAPGTAREISLEEIATFPARLRLALQQAIAQGSASMALDAPTQRALDALHLGSGAVAVAIGGTVVLLRILQHPFTLGEWVVRTAEDGACWLAARAGGGCVG